MKSVDWHIKCDKALKRFNNAYAVQFKAAKVKLCLHLNRSITSAESYQLSSGVSVDDPGLVNANISKLLIGYFFTQRQRSPRLLTGWAEQSVE